MVIWSTLLGGSVIDPFVNLFADISSSTSHGNAIEKRIGVFRSFAKLSKLGGHVHDAKQLIRLSTAISEDADPNWADLLDFASEFSAAHAL